MIPAMDFDDVVAIVAATATHPEPDEWVHGFLDTFDIILPEAETHAPPRFVQITTASILISASPLRPNGSAHQPVLWIIEYWLRQLGYRLRVPAEGCDDIIALARSVAEDTLNSHHGNSEFAAPVAESEATFADIYSWVLEHVICDHGDTLAELSFDGMLGEVPAGFVGCAITAVGEAGLLSARDICGSITGHLEVAGVECFVPVQQPEVNPAVHPDELVGMRERDELQIAVSDLFFVVLDPVAVGIGVTAEMANKYGVQMVVLTDAPMVSPMLVGLDGNTTVLPLSGERDREIRYYLIRYWPKLITHARRRRADVVRWASQIEQFKTRLDSMSDEALTAGGTVTISRDRFHRLLQFPALWGGATHAEVEQLRGLLQGDAAERASAEAAAAEATPKRTPSPLSELTRDQLRALYFAQFQAGWSDQDTDVLEMRGRRRLATTGKFRRSSESPGWWIQLYEESTD